MQAVNVLKVSFLALPLFLLAFNFSFAQVTKVELPNLVSDPSSIAVGDFNNDGIGDVIVASRENPGLNLLLSSTTHNSYQQNEIATTLLISDMKVFDRDQDGDLDVLLTSVQDFHRAIINPGDGAFTNSTPVVGASCGCSEAFIANIDNAGRDELIMARVSTLPLVPSTIAAVITRQLDANDQYFSPYGSSLIFEDYATAADVGDIDHDGYVDVVAASARSVSSDASHIGIWFNSNGDLNAGMSHEIQEPKDISQIRLVDATGDGFLDIVVTNTSEGAYMLPYVGNQNFGDKILIPNTVGARALVGTDLNDDGHNEVVVVRQLEGELAIESYDFVNNVFYLTSNQVIENSTLPLFSSVPHGGYGSDTDIVMHDYDFDGDLEVLVPANDLTTDIATLYVVELSPVYPEITNLAPTFTLLDQTIAEGNPFTFHATATDPDGDTLTYSADDLPTGSTYNSVTGLFEWTPDYDDAGNYDVTFVATDDGDPSLSASTTVTITVENTNRAPVLDSIGNQTINEGQTLQFSVSGTDPDGDTLTYTAANLPDDSTFDGTTFTWNTDYTDAGTYTDVEFTATDDDSPMKSHTELITIYVGNVNRMPNLYVPSEQVALEEDTVTFQVTADDDDGDQVVITATNLPNGAAFDGTNFLWTTDLNDEGVYTVLFTATDDDTNPASTTLGVTVTIGDNPTPTEQAEDLVEGVVDLDLPQNVENSYLAHLNKVEQFIVEGKITPAINQLNAFIQKLDQDYAQNVIDDPEYSDLRAAAENLIDDLQN